MELTLLVLLVKGVDGYVLLVNGRMLKWPVAKINAISTRRGRKGRGQVSSFDTAERNAVGCSDVAIDGYTHNGGSCRAHVNRKANYITNSPFAAVIG